MMGIYFCKRCDSAPVENRDTGLCASCSRDDRRKPKEQIIRPVKKVTEKRAKQNREYLKMREDFLIQYPVCQVKDCQNKATEVHHMKSRTNDMLTNPEYFLAVCNPCHERITRDSAWAIQNGYSFLRTGKTMKL